METKKKKSYKKPLLAKVDLTVEDAVLACCKTSAATNRTGSKRTCGVTACLSSPTNLS